MFRAGFHFVLTNLVSYAGMSLEKSSSAGTSIVPTLLAHRSQVQQKYLVAHTRPGEPTFVAGCGGGDESSVCTALMRR
jgi:hypothetical protein